jgi:hypothetical protein
MTFECLVPFLEASSFQNLHYADVRGIDLGINEDMILLGAGFDLQPCDLLKIIHDKSNKLNRHKVMELLPRLVNLEIILSRMFFFQKFAFQGFFFLRASRAYKA